MEKGNGASQCHCTKEISIFWPPKHILVYPASPLLETKEQFCTSFFHVFNCWEWNIPEHVCLHSDSYKCRHRNITIIVRVVKDGRTVRLARYTNCTTRGRAPIHSEEYIVEDSTLLIPGSKIIMYAQLQPCHHSAGTDADELDQRSCTTLITQWYKEVLQPLGIQLVIKCANIYKAMWEFKEEDIAHLPLDKRCTISCGKARQGLRRLLKSGVVVRALNRVDLEYLQRLCSGKFDISEEKWLAREEAGACIKSYLLSI